MRIPSGTTDQVLFFVAVDVTDLKTRETGLSGFTVYRARDTGAATAYTTPTTAELSAANMPGVYTLLLDEDMTIGSGNDSEEVCLHITHASMAPVTRVFELYRREVTSGETIGVSGGAVSNVTTTATATAVTTVNGLAANVITSTAIANDAITAAKIATGAIDADAIADNAIDAGAIAADAITAAKIADGAIDAATFAAGAITATVAPNLDAAVSSRSTVTTAQVNTEVVDVIRVDTISELAQAAPAATPTVATALMLLYMALRNEFTQTATLATISNDAGTVICKSTTSDDATTFTRGEWVAGP
jgi:hypothetical protein